MTETVLKYDDIKASEVHGGFYGTRVKENDVPQLSVKDLVVSYENGKTGELTEAVNKVSLDIHAGEFVSIVGLSGCGKTTFLNAIAGLIKPRGGTISIRNHIIDGPGSNRPVVFQRPSLLPWRSVVNNIIYGLEIKGTKREEARKLAKKYIEMVHLKGFEQYYPYQLSGGMQQRANLARALICEPDVLLMDEPFASLDAITRETMQNELLSLWEETKKTVLMVTHQIDEALLLSDRVIVFSARPAHVVGEINVNLPRPRTPEVKNNAEFDYLMTKLWSLIRTTGKKADIEYEI